MWRGPRRQRAAEKLEIADDAESDTAASVLFAWLDTFGPLPGQRPYEVSRVGKESDFDAWLETNLQVLDAFGYSLRLLTDETSVRGGRQWRFPDRRRCDLLCHVAVDSANLRRGDWVVIENKAGMADVGAVEQLKGYVDAVSAMPILMDAGQAVHGLLLSDGVTVEGQHAVEQQGFGYLSLSALGYREHLYGLRTETQEDEDFVRLISTVTERLPGGPND